MQDHVDGPEIQGPQAERQAGRQEDYNYKIVYYDQRGVGKLQAGKAFRGCKGLGQERQRMLTLMRAEGDAQESWEDAQGERVQRF